MELTLELPDAAAREIAEGLGDLDRAAKEALLARAYSKGLVSCGKVGELMGFDNRWDAEALLKKFGVWPGYTVEDLEEDRKTMSAFRKSEKSDSERTDGNP